MAMSRGPAVVRRILTLPPARLYNCEKLQLTAVDMAKHWQIHCFGTTVAQKKIKKERTVSNTTQSENAITTLHVVQMDSSTIASIRKQSHRFSFATLWFRTRMATAGWLRFR